MTKLKKLIFYLLIPVFSYSFDIDSVDFNKKIPINQKDTKVFTIKNETDNIYSYDLKIEGDEKVNVFPKKLYIPAKSKKKFIIIVTAKSKKGDYYYILNLNQKILTKNKKLITNMLFRIKQKYTII